MVEAKKWARAKECAARYGMGESTWWRKVKEGLLPQPVRFGRGFTAWDIAECDRFFEENKGK